MVHFEGGDMDPVHTLAALLLAGTIIFGGIVILAGRK